MKLGLTIAAIVCFAIAALPNVPYTGSLTNIGLGLFAAAHITP